MGWVGILIDVVSTEKAMESDCAGVAIAPRMVSRSTLLEKVAGREMILWRFGASLHSMLLSRDGVSRACAVYLEDKPCGEENRNLLGCHVPSC